MVRQRNSSNKKITRKADQVPIAEGRSLIKKLNKKGPANKWTDSEYSSLVLLVRQYGEDWPVIASKFSNKTAKQCMQKFKNSQRSAKKGNWSPEEDEILLKWVKDYGPTKWTECSKHIKGRCGKQCRERWVNILNPHVKKGNWSGEEQNLIFDNLCVHYTSWSSMSKVLPGRTENSIKNYFYSSLRRLKSNPLCNIIKEVYVDKTLDFKNISTHYGNITDELTKLNTLSQRMCSYLLTKESRDENFVQFLVTVIFCEESDIKTPPLPKNLNTTKTHVNGNKNEASIYVPQENNKQIMGAINGVKENDTRSVISVLKKMADQVNKPSLLSVINFLENQLVNSNVENIVDCKNNNIKIRLPFCWNCKTKTCNLHNKEK